jgi:hypothetical protein
MADRCLRDLERRTLAGDADARVAWQRALARTGADPQAAWVGVPLALGVDLDDPRAPREFAEGEVRLTPAGGAALRDDLAHLDAARLLSNYPGVVGDKLPLREQVYLCGYDSVEQTRGRPRPLWLVARSPERRTDPQVVTLVLRATSGTSARHRWTEVRALWDARATTRQDALDDRAERATALLEAGRFDEGLALYGVTLGPEGRALLDGPPELHERSRARLVAALTRSAPWRFEEALGARPHSRERFLTALQTDGAWSECLALRRGSDGALTLDVVATGSRVRVPETSWTRPKR